jgi:hypothetical protein
VSNEEHEVGNIDPGVWDDLLRRSLDEAEEERDFERPLDNETKRYTEAELWEHYRKGYRNGLRIGRYEAQHPELFFDEGPEDDDLLDQMGEEK